MSLNLYTSRKYIPEGMELVERVSAFFDVFVNVTECDMVKRVLKKIDHSKWYSTKVFTSRFQDTGNVAFSNLSGGGKAILSVYYYPEKCFTLRACGENASDMIWTFDKGNVFMPYMRNMDGDLCDIVLNGTEQFFDVEELWRYLYDRPELFDGWDNGRN